MSHELSAIPLQADQIETVTGALVESGLKPHVYQNLEAWEEVACVFQQAIKAPAASQLDGDTQPKPEKCLLLVGSLAEIAERGLPERISQVHPGLPIVAAGQSPSLADVARVMRQGVTDVVDLDHEPNGFANTVKQAIARGTENEGQRLRIRELRRRLSTLTDAEREVLDAMMDGLANKETAKKLGIGLRTVELRRAKIMNKMGAKSVAELVKLFCEARCPGVNTRAQAR